MPALDPARRTALNATKLRALVEGQFGVIEPAAAAPLIGGAALADERRAFVLPGERPERSLGATMAWAEAQAAHGDALEVHLLVDEHAGDLARRASLFTDPPTVWQINGRSIRVADPAPVADIGPLTPDAAALGRVLEQAGLDVVVEHGCIVGEVLGLEVARVVVDADGRASIEVGVGRHDREAFAIVHGDLPTADALRSAIDTVSAQRRHDNPHHPLSQLASERWLLDRSMRDPELFGSWPIARRAGTVARESVKDVLPALAAGLDGEGRAVMVAASVGVDVDLIPVAGDARSAWDADARLIVLVPERDALGVTRRLASRLRRPAEVRTITGDWRVPPTLGDDDRTTG